VGEIRASLDRMARFGVRPNRELGQNFLIDENILELIGRTAELAPSDVVLEIGGGLGSLSTYLAGRVTHLHVIESDAALEPVLTAALADHANASLSIGDVMDADLAVLVPGPNKVVANLPYGVAVPAILRTIEQLHDAHLWCVMVQREIADRLAAAPGTKAYGIPSVLVQLACDVRFVRAIPRTVFRPQPRVESALVVLRRTGPPAPGAVRELVRACFAHRRKALARSVELAEHGDSPVRAALRSALEQMGHPANERAERLAPQEFAELAERLRA
jgi:16S rRNA (adenine1518-N6/adenine1519-N6)-dimethyltransferase